MSSMPALGGPGPRVATIIVALLGFRLVAMWSFTPPQVHAVVRLLFGSTRNDRYIEGWMQHFDCSAVPLFTSVRPRGGVERCEILGPSLVPRWVAPPRSGHCTGLPRHSGELPKNIF